MDAKTVGWGHTPFRALGGTSFEDLIRGAAKKTMDHAGVGAQDIDAIWPGHFNAGLVPDGTVMADGALPVNLSGGLRAKGHPVGATGVSMHVMAARQVTGTAGKMQRDRAVLGRVFNMGGSGVANYRSILEAEK